MADNDFFNTDPAPQDKPVISEAKQEVPEKIKLGDKEYLPDEASKLVGLGERYQEIETKYNTKLDRVWPEYTKSQQVNKEQAEKLAQLETELNSYKQTQTGKLTPEQKEAAKQSLRDIFGDELMTKKEAEQLVDTRNSAKDLLEEIKDYADDINGSDGRPAFKTDDVLTYMRDTGIRKPLDAYELMHKEQLAEWKVQQLSKTKSPGLVTQTGGATNKQPVEVRPNKDNIDELLKETLWGKSEE